LDSTILVFVLGLFIGLITLSYQKPEVHRDIISPLIGKAFFPLAFLAWGSAGALMLFAAQIKPFIAPDKIADADRILQTFLAASSGIFVVGLALILFDIFLMKIASHARKHAAERNEQ